MELKLRMLADKVPELQKYAHAARLEKVEEEVIAHFAGALASKERSVLSRCRQLRNKILHGDFTAARGKLSELGAPLPPRCVVRKIDICGLSLPELEKKGAQAQAGDRSVYEDVADTNTKESGTIFGWLLEMHSTSAFQEAVTVFRKAAQIIDRLAGPHTTGTGIGDRPRF